MISINGKVFDYIDKQNPNHMYCSCSCAKEEGTDNVLRIYDHEYTGYLHRHNTTTISSTCRHCGAVLDCFGEGEKSPQQVRNHILDVVFSDSA